MVSFLTSPLMAQMPRLAERGIPLHSTVKHHGPQTWSMKLAGEVKEGGEKLSLAGYNDRSWMPAIVPGTVLQSLVYNKVYPEPYFGVNNQLEQKLIPDITEIGRDGYTYWFRTDFAVPDSYRGKQIWLRVDGINYRAEIWVNGRLLSTVNGMFMQDHINVTDYVQPGASNGLAVKVYPVDRPGSTQRKSWGAAGEFRNGGDGEIGCNTTMLMSVGWDFTFMDGIRDRNTGIWRGITLYATGQVAMRHPFVRSQLSHPSYDQADETISVELVNPSTHNRPLTCLVKGEIVGEGITFEKEVRLIRGEEKEITFTARDFPQLHIDRPRLWWPVNKGTPHLYQLKMSVSIDGVVSDSLYTRFGIREITSDRRTPDGSRLFYINGKRLFIRGSNWIPEAMLRMSDERTYAELRYTRQAGINLLRLWGGGIAESDYFYQLCDELGILVWQEFWMTGDTRHPHDKSLYMGNVVSTVKRIRNHPCVAYYVASNESSEVSGMEQLLLRLDGTRGYQMQSECDGVHDGSPYKQVNPMQHYENSASDRGSRIDGFNPEYGAPTLPLVESLREMMDEKDLWPINPKVWDYLDGNGFHLMSSLYKELTDQYGPSQSIDEFARKGQLVGAMNAKSIWEVWNYNKLDYGDRFCSGLLFWYHNCPVPQVASRMWDWMLEPTAALYHTAHSLEPLHVQFDYLKNTVSVVNDCFQPYQNYRVRAEIYDWDSRRVWEGKTVVDLPEDGVANDVLTLHFPQDITKVHFVYLTLTDERGNLVSSNLYWRSTDAYLGKKTLTGPATSGFESLSHLPSARLKMRTHTRQADGRCYVDITLRNVSSRIAFFNQLHLTNLQGRPIRPAFYTDNFFTLMPGEEKQVTIDADAGLTAEGVRLQLKGWNISSQEVILKEARQLPEKPWAIGPFSRPDGVNPVISPLATTFPCPMRKEDVKWEESDTFNPAATVRGDRVVVLYRAEDHSGKGIGRRTSRIGYAESKDGFHFQRQPSPILYPAEDACSEFEWSGGCEDPRVAMTEDGTYVMFYTAWNRQTARLSVATSRDLKHWTKHGPVFRKAFNGRFAHLFCKSASILTRLDRGRLVIDRVDGKYFMYWGEHAVHAATSDNLIDWTPLLDDDQNLRKLALPRKGFFDSLFTECGPPALRTAHGIVLMYNGKNSHTNGDKDYPSGAYCAGQMLFDAHDPCRLIDRLDKPFFYPETAFEKSGQYKDGTVFIEGLAYFKQKFFLYYGCADSRVGVATSPAK